MSKNNQDPNDTFHPNRKYNENSTSQNSGINSSKNGPTVEIPDVFIENISDPDEKKHAKEEFLVFRTVAEKVENEIMNKEEKKGDENTKESDCLDVILTNILDTTDKRGNPTTRLESLTNEFVIREYIKLVPSCFENILRHKPGYSEDDMKKKYRQYC